MMLIVHLLRHHLLFVPDPEVLACVSGSLGNAGASPEISWSGLDKSGYEGYTEHDADSVSDRGDHVVEEESQGMMST